MIAQTLTGMADIFLVTVSNRKEYFCNEFISEPVPLKPVMKSRLISILLVVNLFSLIACEKETSNENGNIAGPAKGDFYAILDGKQWNADSVQLILVSSNGATITGISKAGDQISMVLPVFKTGTYMLGTQSSSYALFGNLLTNNTNVYVSNSGTAGGTITISSIDTINQLVSGSFQFMLVNPADNSSVTITNGIFSYVPYGSGMGGNVNPPVGGGADTLNANIDGVKFVSSDILPSLVNGQLLIAGFSMNGSQDIGLLMPPDIKPGSYPLDFATGLYIGIYNPSPTVTLISQNSGTLTILSHDIVAKKIKGTFDFTASPTGTGTPAVKAVITQGYFSVNY
jgi:hypothetical protein